MGKLQDAAAAAADEIAVTLRAGFNFPALRNAELGLRAALAAEWWQPIGAAPKDGTHVLAWGPLSGGPHVVYFGDGCKRAERWQLAYGSSEFWGSELLTHWMPLPAPPEGLASHSMTDDGSVTDAVSGVSHPSGADGRSG